MLVVRRQRYAIRRGGTSGTLVLVPPCPKRCASPRLVSGHLWLPRQIAFIIPGLPNRALVEANADGPAAVLILRPCSVSTPGCHPPESKSRGRLLSPEHALAREPPPCRGPGASLPNRRDEHGPSRTPDFWPSRTSGRGVFRGPSVRARTACRSRSRPHRVHAPLIGPNGPPGKTTRAQFRSAALTARTAARSGWRRRIESPSPPPHRSPALGLTPPFR